MSGPVSKAYVEWDFQSLGVRAAMFRDLGGGRRDLLQWADFPTVKHIDDVSAAAEPSREDWLRLTEEDARALYEALADHFGHSGNDTRALRRDYDAERARVDKLIGHLTGGATP